MFSLSHQPTILKTKDRTKDNMEALTLANFSSIFSLTFVLSPISLTPMGFTGSTQPFIDTCHFLGPQTLIKCTSISQGYFSKLHLFSPPRIDKILSESCLETGARKKTKGQLHLVAFFISNRDRAFHIWTLTAIHCSGPCVTSTTGPQ